MGLVTIHCLLRYFFHAKKLVEHTDELLKLRGHLKQMFPCSRVSFVKSACRAVLILLLIVLFLHALCFSCSAPGSEQISFAVVIHPLL